MIRVFTKKKKTQICHSQLASLDTYFHFKMAKPAQAYQLKQL